MAGGEKRPKQSRQQRWQIHQRTKGNCGICGKPRNHYAVLCDACAEKQRLRQRKRKGYKHWRPGGIGRPPILKA